MKSASSLKYIGVWILWIIITLIFTLGATLFLSVVGIYKDCNKTSETIFVIITYSIGALAFINIYKIFPDIKISKVMIYLWILGFVGVSQLFADIRQSLNLCGISINDSPWLAAALLFGYIGHNLTIRYYFKKTSQWDGKHLLD